MGFRPEWACVKVEPELFQLPSSWRCQRSRNPAPRRPAGRETGVDRVWAGDGEVLGIQGQGRLSELTEAPSFTP